MIWKYEYEIRFLKKYVNGNIPGSYFFWNGQKCPRYVINAGFLLRAVMESHAAWHSKSSRQRLRVPAQQAGCSLSITLDRKLSASNSLVGWGMNTVQRTDREKRFKILFHFKRPPWVTSELELGYDINILLNRVGDWILKDTHYGLEMQQYCKTGPCRKEKKYIYNSSCASDGLQQEYKINLDTENSPWRKATSH